MDTWDKSPRAVTVAGLGGVGAPLAGMLLALDDVGGGRPRVGSFS